MMSRREILKGVAHAGVAAGCGPILNLVEHISSDYKAIRCINVVNFIREIEPRFPMDMMLPITSQMELILANKLPATWLLQFDALVSGPFVPFLKEHMATSHEVGLWFEMNEKHCKAADVRWRGRPGYEWDMDPRIAFTIGYTIDERIKLADTAMRQFKAIWGRYPSSIASWNLDAYTCAHLTEHYKIDAYAVCRDQIATDGFTIWGTPIAGYYPSKTNCWSPAVQHENQINTPIFRMLGQDPVYYYDKDWTLPDGRRVSGPDTMEPAWISGQSPGFVDSFFDMIAKAPSLGFAYAQLGQENTFPWPQQEAGYRMQMPKLAALREEGKIHVETLGETGRRFKKAFRSTPAQAQVQLTDPFGNASPAEHSIWYQSRNYRANLHIKGNLAYFRDLTLYSDANPQPFLTEPTHDTSVEQRMPSALDGYHWARKDPPTGEPGAGGFLSFQGKPIRLNGRPKVTGNDVTTLKVELPNDTGRTLIVNFGENSISIRFADGLCKGLELAFRWDASQATLEKVVNNRATFQGQTLRYAVQVTNGDASQTADGWSIQGSDTGIVLSRPSL